MSRKETREEFISKTMARLKPKGYGSTIIRLANEKTEQYNEVALENIRVRTSLQALVEGLRGKGNKNDPVAFYTHSTIPPSLPKVEKGKDRDETAFLGQRRINDIEEFIPMIQEDTKKMEAAFAVALQSIPNLENKAFLLNFSEKMISAAGLKVDLKQGTPSKRNVPQGWKKLRDKALPNL